ncbi:MAG TPA: MMPL family transporter [Solirubrobacterales bacterium]|nr:MMPL family transporter [Solirubrobacterales bacterium]
MSALMRKIGAFAARRAPWVVAVWVVIAIGLVVVANSVGRPENDDVTLPGTGSQSATDLLDKYLPAQANGSVPIVLQSDTSLAQGQNAQAVNDTVKSLSQNQYVQSVVSPFSQQGADQITKDGKIAYINLALKVSSGDLDDDEANSVLDAAEPARNAGIKVSAGGYLGQQLSSPSTGLSEAIGVLAALIILVFAFRTFVAAPLPITTAVVALASSLAVIGLAGHAFDVPSIAPTLGIMLGLAVGTDYSLFIISRHLRFLQEGVEPNESIGRSVGTSGSAVVFAGCTVIVALLCLYFSGIPLVRELGYTTAIVVAIAVIAAITFLPAILGLLGRRILKLPFRLGERKHDADHPGGWARWAGAIRSHPIVASVIGIVALGLIAIPALDMRLGAEDYGQLPTDTTERQAYDALTKGFGVGTNGPLLIAVKVTGQPLAAPSPQDAQSEEQQGVPPQIATTPAGDPRLVTLQQDISKDNNVQSVSPAVTDKSGNAAVFSVTPKTSPSAYATQDLVNHLRDKTIPGATKGTGLTAYVGGTTASYIDLATKISDKLFLVIGIVVLLSFLLLTLAFRTVLVPLISALVNLLAVGAAYGVLTAVFEKGFALSLIGVDHEMPVVSYVPLMMFAILFGLSMDYQVFLVSRITERHQGGADNSEAVRAGLVNAGRVIAAAATIMFAVFFSFVLNGDPVVKQFGVGLAVAVAIDALVVLLIMPGILELTGERNWFLPRWLDRALPDLKVEGDPEMQTKTPATPASA